MKKLLLTLALCLLVLPCFALPVNQNPTYSFGKKKGSTTGSSTTAQKTVTLAEDEVKATLPDGFSGLTVLLSDNCPQNTVSLTAQLSLKATIPGYKGSFNFEIQAGNEIVNVKTLMEYVSCCNQLKNAMEKEFNKPFSLRYNTLSDGTGTDLNLEDYTQAVNCFISQNITQLYAIYETIAVEEVQP